MRDWQLIPSLITLRDEFNAIAPRRDHGADGSIGDANHTTSSDHCPDEISRILRDRDSDDVNEVHALDVDSSGPWPGGTNLATYVDFVVAQHRAGREDRLQNVIYQGRIASASWGWKWIPYAGPSAHKDHAHFSGRYITSAEKNTRSWGLAGLVPKQPATQQEESTDMQDEVIEITAACAKRIGKQPGERVKLSLLVQYAIIAGVDAQRAIGELQAPAAGSAAKA